MYDEESKKRKEAQDAHYRKNIEDFKAEEQEIWEKVEALYRHPDMTEKKKRRADEYRQAMPTTMQRIFPKFFLSYPIKYWSIKKLFIDPFTEYMKRLDTVRELIKYNEQLLYMNPSENGVNTWKKHQNTTVIVTIDYDVDPGDCGDC